MHRLLFSLFFFFVVTHNTDQWKTKNASYYLQTEVKIRHGVEKVDRKKTSETLNL